MNSKKTSSKIWDNRFVWAILAILSSLILWVYVTMTEGDLISKTFDNVQVVFFGEDTLREKSGLIITNPSVTAVTVRLEGTRSEISNLSADLITAVINVSAITAEGGNTEIPKITFASGTSTSTITNITPSPSTVSYSIVREESDTISLRGEFNGSVAEGYVRKSIIFEPETITIYGPKSEISKVSSALVVIDRENIDRTLSFDSTFTLVDSNGREVPRGNMRLSTESVAVTLPISATKEVPLTVDTVDGAGATSENIKITCDPQTITIAGDAETLEGINKISLSTIDLASFQSTFESTFPIVLDNNITNVTGITEARVTIQVIGLETRTFSVSNISVINITPGYAVEIVTKSTDVTLRGPAEVLAQIEENNLRLVADITELGSATGEFEPIAKVHVDGFTGVGAIGVYNIFIKIQ